MANKLVQDYFDTLKGKHVAVLGIGVSNRPLIKLLLANGIQTTACDKAERAALDAEVLELEQLGATLKLGETYLDELNADIIFRTPGMHPDTPALVSLRDKGVKITSEMDVFFSVCPCTIIAVTGSDGKTTTTTLIAEILKEAGKTVWIGGNIGRPLLPLAEQMSPEDFAVVELSSFQLMDMTHSPHVAVCTNLAPNHLDVHKDMDEYIRAKETIFRFQTPNDRLVINLDNEITAQFAHKAASHVCGFSRNNETENGACLKGDCLYYRGKYAFDRSEIRIPGMHNVENYMAALCAVDGYATLDDVKTVARKFSGVEHRIEFVRELNGVKYYNDSIASSPTRTIAGLHAFNQKVVLIAGGYDKHIPFDVLGPEIITHVKHLILCGATAQKILDAVKNAPGYREDLLQITLVENLETAVMTAHKTSIPHDVVTLSPACAAFDQFKNFMVRGNRYKELVMALR